MTIYIPETTSHATSRCRVDAFWVEFVTIYTRLRVRDNIYTRNNSSRNKSVSCWCVLIISNVTFPPPFAAILSIRDDMSIQFVTIYTNRAFPNFNVTSHASIRYNPISSWQHLVREFFLSFFLAKEGAIAPVLRRCQRTLSLLWALSLVSSLSYAS